MLYRKVILVTIASTCLARTVYNAAEFAAIDKLAETVTSPATSKGALAALEMLAEGKPESVPPQLADQIGMRPIPAGWLTYKQLPVRIRAIQKLAKTGDPEALLYLSNLKEEEFAPDIGQREQLGEAIQTSLRSMQLAKISDTQGKVQFLEQLAIDHSFRGQYWAVNQLCDMGSLISYPVVMQSIRDRVRNAAREEEQLNFCQQRMNVIRGNPDRTLALISVLNSDRERQNAPLLKWAADLLLEVGSPDAMKALEEYSRAVESLPGRSAASIDLQLIKENIDEELRRRAARPAVTRVQ